MRINLDTEYQAGSLSQGNSIHSDRPRLQQTGAESVQASGFAASLGIGSDSPFAKEDKAPMTELAAETGKGDVRRMTDHMAVMSLSMSDEDYSEMVRTGQMPEDTDAGDSVTILDNIKAAHIKAGANVAGYTDTIDAETLAKITGSVAAANGLMDKITSSGLDPVSLTDTFHAQDITVSPDNISRITEAVELAAGSLPLSDDATAFLVSENKTPTVENIYHASNAGSADSMGGKRYYSEDGYVSRGADALTDEEMENLRPQIEDTIRRAGLDIVEETLADARLLISHNIPLTPETLLETDSLRVLRNDVSADRLAASVAIAISAGIPAQKANLTYDESIYLKAEETHELVQSIPDEVIDKISEQGEMLNIRALRAASKQVFDTRETGADLNTESPEIIHARRVLEEVRISMSVEANRMLLRTNFRIDIAPMEELAEALRQAEQTIAGRLFPSEEENVTASRMEMYIQTKTELSVIPSLPAAILGQYRPAGNLQFGFGETYTLHEVYESGNVRRDAYIRAEETYEALMTAPRADMGDSIRKAFRNADDILADLGLEVDEYNRRAVRILGYNSTEITPEKIEQVREADLGLRYVLNRLTPERVINMIRSDINPLNMPIQELSEYLDGQDSEPERQAADYARFLMQLERQNEITELERDSYIGIYRMISKLDRTDDAAVGKLLEMGVQMSFAGLLSAMRSAARGGMDYRVGDDFGGVDSLRSDALIDEQINAAFTAGRFAEGSRTAETVIENILMSGEAVSLNNIEAMNALKSKRADWIRPVLDNMLSTGSLAEETEAVIDRMTDEDSAREAYDGMLDKAKEQIAGRILDADRYIDVRAMASSLKQVNILRRLSGDEVYDLPTEIDGELTSIRLTIRHESGAGRIAITMMTEVLGNVACDISMRGEASGYIAYEKEDALVRLNKIADMLMDELGFMPELVRADHIDPEKYTDRFFNSEKMKNEIKESDEGADINNIELYKTARTLISALRNL